MNKTSNSETGADLIDIYDFYNLNVLRAFHQFYSDNYKKKSANLINNQFKQSELFHSIKLTNLVAIK